MIEIKNLSKSFKDKKVLNKLNLSIPDGTVFGLVGINGAGKSTLLRLISGIYKADKGDILIDGEEVYENEKIKNTIFFLPDEPFYGINTTPISLIDLYHTFYSFDKDEYIKYLETFNIPLKKQINNFSKGMKRQVFVSLALAIKPKYLLLDEAFDGLDPLARLAFRRAIIDLVEDNNTTIIISSHSLRELEDICDSYGLLDNMEITSSGNIQDRLETYHKYQIAFKEVVNKDNLDFKLISYNQEGRVIKIVTPLNLEELGDKINKYNPLIIDEIPIDFEELFIIEVESRGYLK